jgi:NitT/TauT family transport system substrate-binding protein
MRVTRRSILQSLPAALMLGQARADEKAPAIRIGILRFGSVQWELETMRAQGLDAAHGVQVSTTEYAASQATQVALQAQAVDMVALDWLWVSRQRETGADWTFAPLSSALGALIVPAGSAIRSVPDLAGKRLGIAGTPLDKSWLILRAYAKSRFGLAIDQAAETSFAAPPLLDQALAAGRLDAVLNYWPFAAKAEARGATSLIGVGAMLAELGIPATVPMVGYVFSERWAAANRAAVAGFLKAAAAARGVLASSDAAWETLKPLTGASDEAELLHLRDWYRSGIPNAAAPPDLSAADHLYHLLRDIGGPDLTGPAESPAPGVFWAG